MKLLLTGLLLVLASFGTSAQAVSKEQAIAIAKQKGYYKNTGDWQKPDVQFESTMTWRIHSYKARTSRRGKCKKTNGCTIVHSRTIWIDSENGKILRKKKERKRYPNYE